MTAPTQAPLSRLALLGVIFNSTGTYGTEQSVAGGLPVLAKNFGMGDTKPGQYFSEGSSLKFQQVEYLLDVKGHFEMKMDMRYDGAGPALLGALLGVGPVVAEQAPTVVDISAYLHTWGWVDYNTNIGTIALWFGQSNGTLQVLNSCKLSSCVLEAKPNGAVVATFKGMGNRVDISPAASTTNTTGILTTLVNAIGVDHVKQGMMYWHARTLASQNAGFLRIRAVTGSEGNCTSSDDLFSNELKLTFDRRLKQPQSQDKQYGEPYEEGQPHMKIDLSVPGFEGNPSDKNGVAYQLVQDLQSSYNGTPKEYKIDLYFESPALAGAATQKYGARFFLPSVALKLPNPNISSMGMAGVKIDGTLMCPFAAANGSDWSGLSVLPVTFKLWNKRSTVYFS